MPSVHRPQPADLERSHASLAPKAQPKETPPPPHPTSPESLKADLLKMELEPSGTAPESLALFDSGETDARTGRDGAIKSVHINLGYVLDNQVLHAGPMRLQHAERGSDFEISGYQQTDRKNWEYLSFKPGQRFAPDEPQFNVGVGIGFAHGLGVELDAKHNKIIMDGYEQEVHFEGTLNGSAIDESGPLNQVMQQHEQTLGNMQISALGTYTFDLPAPGRHRFSWVTKAGPSLITTNTRTRILDPDGEFSGGTSKFQAVGYGAMLENGLRYQFGPKLAQLGLELSHSLSYLNYANYQSVDGYTGSHQAVYSGVALKATVGLFGNRQAPPQN